MDRVISDLISSLTQVPDAPVPKSPASPIEEPHEVVRKRDEIAMLERFWSNRLEAYKQQNEKLKQQLDSLNEVQLSSPPRQAPKSPAAASDEQVNLQKCLEQNSQQPLRCCREVKDFVRTVTES
jgi:hypothetical protein